nr:XrtA/PEP-CTERM system histidine kinase PrsK [Sphingomonas sp. Y57]
MARGLEAAMLAQQTELPPVHAAALPDTVILAATQWGHGLAAFMFAALVCWQATVRSGGPRRVALTLACALTALWCVLVARYGGGGISSSVAKSLADIAWLGFLFALQPPLAAGRRRPAILAIYGLLALLLIAAIVIKLLPLAFSGSPRIQAGLFLTGQSLRIASAIGGLCLLHNLYTAASPEARFGLGAPMLALAVMWTFDLNLATVAYLINGWPTGLFGLRGLVMVLIAPLLVTVSRLATLDRMRVSRSAGFQTLTLVLSGAYLAAMVLAARLLAVVGKLALLPQITVAAVFVTFALSLFPSTRYRQRLKKTLGRQLFQHRYDYRLEWRRFTETVGQPGDDAPPLAERTVKAIADIFDCPGGLLMLRAPDGGLEASARWNWPALDPPLAAAGTGLAQHLQADGVVEVERLRRGEEPEAATQVPAWMVDETEAWVLVPLIHFDRLVGAVLLERPREPRLLDDEDHDLLRLAGRQVASYLAEAQGQEALSDARRFDEFNRRFAFIMHDIKNLVSQLSLLARNAERHADKPEFRADMIDTLQNSVGKMNDLLARLSQHHRARPDEPAPHSLRTLVEEVVRDRSDGHAVRIVGRDDVMATVDPDRFEQALGHLVQNAIDASDPAAQVEIVIGRRGLEAVVEVIDHGCGMSAEFVRTRLFHPFSSTKDGGFGIGAYEARALVAGMGGRLEVQSRPGEGSRFTIVLPLTALLGGDLSKGAA